MKSFKKIVLTGAAGFIGSHVADAIAEAYPDAKLVIFDKLTYAAHIDNILALIQRDNVQLVVGDLCNFDVCNRVTHDADLVINLAAESHVDNSFEGSLLFTQSNTVGTHVLVEACRQQRVPFLLHVSTDEVYGQVLHDFVDETAILNPTNPYSASKAGAEMIINSYKLSYNSPILVVRANNIYGPRQFPEKLIPRCIMNLIYGRKITLHGDGTHRRHFLAAQDFAQAIVLLIEKGKIGDVYNVGSHEEYQNFQVATMIAHQFGKELAEVAEFVPDRPFNDARYAIRSEKIHALGWTTKRRLADDMEMLVQWYKDHAHRYPDF